VYLELDSSQDQKVGALESSLFGRFFGCLRPARPSYAIGSTEGVVLSTQDPSKLGLATLNTTGTTESFFLTIGNGHQPPRVREAQAEVSRVL